MKYVLLFIVLLGSFNLSAQTIKGRVIEKNEQENIGLPGASVFWDGTTEGASTDENGYFEIEWNPAARITVSYVGFKPLTLEVKRTDRQLEIVLTPGEELQEVTVMARMTPTRLTTRGAMIEQVITGEELCKAACCNLGESFTTNASVDVAYADAVTGAKQIQLLGLTGKYVQMMTENMPNFRGVSSLYGLNYVPGPWMSAISVSKGVGSVTNGYEAIAGQISVDYKKPRTSEKIFLNVYGSSEQMYEINANAGVVLNDKWSTALLVHYDHLGKAHDSNKDGFLDMPKQDQYNIFNRWEYKTDMWNIQFGGKFIDETRLGGQKGFRKNMRHDIGTDNLYGIGIDNRRYEGFLKLGYLMPEYEHASMALLINYTDHDQDAYYGAKNYNARQRTLFANYIFQSVFGNNENQKYSAGLSFDYDDYDESFNDYLPKAGVKTGTASFDRTERVAGAFFQYTGKFWDQLTVMAGVRYDYHSKHDGIFTPRLHVAYAPDDMTIFKVSAGSGARTANILADNSYLLASAFPIQVNGKYLYEHPEEVDKLDMEKAWNFGVLVSRKFLLFDRLLTINLDYYRTNFNKQVVIDNETDPAVINFYNLDGDSYSNCYQAEVKYELIPRLEILGAFRYNDVRVTVGDRLLRQPLQSKYKGLLNLSYYTNMKKWQFDFTAQFNGPGRLPGDEGEFDNFTIMNAQVSKFFRKWSIYAGCENIGDFTQKDPIVAATDPWGTDFDSSKIWGPVHGRKFYLGLRFGINRD